MISLDGLCVLPWMSSASGKHFSKESCPKVCAQRPNKSSIKEMQPTMTRFLPALGC